MLTIRIAPILHPLGIYSDVSAGHWVFNRQADSVTFDSLNALRESNAYLFLTASGPSTKISHASHHIYWSFWSFHICLYISHLHLATQRTASSSNDTCAIPRARAGRRRLRTPSSVDTSWYLGFKNSLNKTRSNDLQSMIQKIWYKRYDTWRLDTQIILHQAYSREKVVDPPRRRACVSASSWVAFFIFRWEQTCIRLRQHAEYL